MPTRRELPELGQLIDGDLELVLDSPEALNPGWHFSYTFKLMLTGKDTVIGSIELRDGATHHVENAGHIAYEITPAYRGQRYAARACKLLLPLARSHNIEQLRIVCRPENIASRRTCEIIGAELIDIVELAEDTDMYKRGYRQICRYTLNL